VVTTDLLSHSKQADFSGLAYEKRKRKRKQSWPKPQLLPGVCPRLNAKVQSHTHFILTVNLFSLCQIHL